MTNRWKLTFSSNESANESGGDIDVRAQQPNGGSVLGGSQHCGHFVVTAYRRCTLIGGSCSNDSTQHKIGSLRVRRGAAGLVLDWLRTAGWQVKVRRFCWGMLTQARVGEIGAY